MFSEHIKISRLVNFFSGRLNGVGRGRMWKINSLERILKIQEARKQFPACRSADNYARENLNRLEPAGDFAETLQLVFDIQSLTSLFFSD